MDIILVMAVIVMVLTLWLLHCNDKTHKQRIQRLESMQYGADNWAERLQDFQSVSYYSHLFSLTTFRNPDRLYKFK
jgi:lipopolysaccharide export system protein LptC